MSRMIYFAALAAVLSGCARLPVESAVSACPAAALEEVTFHTGAPAGPAIVPQDGLWRFHEGQDTYLRCVYADGFVRVQRLPAQMRSCKMAEGGGLSCRSLI